MPSRSYTRPAPLQRLLHDLRCAEIDDPYTVAWQSVMAAALPIGPMLWALLPEMQRLRFLRLQGAWFSRLFAMRMGSARLIAEMAKTGQLVLQDSVFIPEKTRYVTSAAGVCHNVRQSTNVLLRAMLHRGYLVAHPGGGIRARASTLQVTDACAHVAPNIFAVGPLLRGEFLLTNGIPFSVRCATILASHLVRDCRDGIPYSQCA
jgi:uncharacterized NAD(P)/FAD-binding protein YdhS